MICRVTNLDLKNELHVSLRVWLSDLRADRLLNTIVFLCEVKCQGNSVTCNCSKIGLSYDLMDFNTFVFSVIELFSLLMLKLSHFWLVIPSLSLFLCPLDKTLVGLGSFLA